MSTSNVKGKKVTLLIFGSIFIVLGTLILSFLNGTTILIMHVTFALFNNTPIAVYIAIALAGLLLPLGVVLGILGLKVKPEEANEA